MSLPPRCITRRISKMKYINDGKGYQVSTKANPGDPPVPWQRWFQSFQTYLVACGLDDKPVTDARRRVILLHYLGTEGQRVFSSLNAGSDSYEESTAALHRHFGPKHSVIMSQYKFRQRNQQADESVIQFVAASRGLATF